MTTTPLGDFALAGAAAWDAFEPLLDEDALTAIARAAKVLIAFEADSRTLETARTSEKRREHTSHSRSSITRARTKHTASHSRCARATSG